jgi:hypothetical protein
MHDDCHSGTFAPVRCRPPHPLDFKDLHQVCGASIVISRIATAAMARLRKSGADPCREMLHDG